MRALLVALLVACAAVQAVAPAAAAPAEPEPGTTTTEPASGRELFVTGCSSCHGLAGDGTPDGPSLRAAGAAAAYYYLSTGRMPATSDREQPRRKDPAYGPEQIERLVDYVASLGAGPPLPVLAPGKIARGGELYRNNCAPCHSAAGIGGALSYGQAAPSIHPATPLQVASAIRVGPGQMPLFDPGVLSDDDVADIVAYVGYLKSPANPGGARLGGAGPIPEGAVAWLFGMGLLMVGTAWIGKRVHR